MTCGGITSGPRPYYEEVPSNVVEKHETILSQHLHAAGVLTREAWSVPAPDQTLSLGLQNVSVIPVGSYFYNEAYGYYRITQWNPETGVIGLANDRTNGNAAPGTYVPLGTPFLVVPKPCCDGAESNFFPFLADDFIAPSNGSTVTVNVTSSFGLSQGDYVRLGDALYKIDSIPSTRQIVLLNEGAGADTGSTVSARDSNNELQYLLVSEPSYVCTGGDPVTSGKLIICDGTDQKILSGLQEGQVPLLTTTPGEIVEFGFIDTVSLVDSAVSASKIAAGAVVAGKLGSSAVAEANIAVGAVTTSKIGDDQVTAAKIADGAVGTDQLAALGVTSAKLAADSVITAKILDQNVTSAKIADGAVDTAKIALAAVNLDRIADGNVTEAKLQNGSVTENKLGALAVTAAKLAADAVETAKVADYAITSIKLAGIGATQVYTPVLDSLSGISASSLTGIYWVYGPFVLVRVTLSLTFSGIVAAVSISCPTSGVNYGGGTEYFPAVPYTTSGTSTGLAASKAAVLLISGIPKILVSAYPNGVTAPGETLNAVIWAFYPQRT